MRCAVALAALTVIASATAQTPYARFHGTGHLGPPGRSASTSTQSDTVRIGVVGPATGAATEAMSAAVAMAVAEANAAGDGPPLAVRYRGDDGPWSSAAAAAVHLVREEGVAALIAGPDGARAHACELVAAKLWVPVLAPAAADHTVDYANVPWVFRSGPDDRAQLRALLTAATEHGWRRLAWIDDGHRDAAVAEITAQRLARSLGLALVRLSDPVAEVDAAVVWGGVDAAAELLALVRRVAPALPVIGPWTLSAPGATAANGDGLLLCAVPTTANDAKWVDFARRWRARTGVEPTWLAALTYDAAQLLTKAVARAGCEPAALRRELASATLTGATGSIAFDTLGGRRGEAIVTGAGWISASESRR